MRPETKSPEKELSYYKAGVIAHNACNSPEKLDRAINSKIPHIEADLSYYNEMLVVAHSLDEFLLLTLRQQEIQKPDDIFRKIYDAGKHAFLDLKDETKGKEIFDNLPDYLRNDTEAMASSNNHEDLEKLKESGFAGKILYSIGTQAKWREFMENNAGKVFENMEFGVSIRHTLLSDSVNNQLKKMGLIVAAWSPETEEEIKRCLNFDVDFVTSNKFGMLEKIGKPEPTLSTTTLEPQLPAQG